MKISLRLMALLQGIYYLPTAIWPYLHLNSFLFVTGPKTDIWLLKTVALLLAVIAVVLLVAWFRNSVSTEIKLLAIGSALGLIGIDLYYSSTNTISAIYRYDALAEALLVLGWLLAKNQRGNLTES